MTLVMSVRSEMPAGCRRSSVCRQDAGAPLLAGGMPALQVYSFFALVLAIQRTSTVVRSVKLAGFAR